jgi:hypothetical protein
MMTTQKVNSSLPRKNVATSFAEQLIKISLSIKSSSQGKVILSNALNKGAEK